MRWSTIVTIGVVLATSKASLICPAGHCATTIPTSGTSNSGTARSGLDPIRKTDSSESKEPARLAAIEWIDLLRSRSELKLAKATSFPFVYETTNRKKQCERSVGDEKAFKTIIACLVKKDKLLLGELDRASTLEFKDVRPSDAPASLRGILPALAKNETLLMTFINGDGVTFEFVLLVRLGAESKPMVGGLFVNAEFETG